MTSEELWLVVGVPMGVYTAGVALIGWFLGRRFDQLGRDLNQAERAGPTMADIEDLRRLVEQQREENSRLWAMLDQDALAALDGLKRFEGRRAEMADPAGA
jgi:hypothetical protein